MYIFLSRWHFLIGRDLWSGSCLSLRRISNFTCQMDERLWNPPNSILSFLGWEKGRGNYEGKSTPFAVLQAPKRSELKGTSYASKFHWDIIVMGHIPQEAIVASPSPAWVGSLEVHCTPISHRSYATDGLPSRALSSFGEHFSSLRDEAVTPLLNFVMGSGKEDARTWS